jgi:hypothetical protein
MLVLMLIWLAVGVGLTWLAGQKPGSAGLPLAYFLGLSLIHVPGALTVLAGAAFDSDPTTVGFEQMVIGMIAFLVGVAIARYVPALRVQVSGDFTSQRFALLNKAALLYLCIGLFVMFATPSFVFDIPSAGAILSSLGSLVIVAACLQLWIAIKTRNSLKFWSTVALLPLLPLLTVIRSGFLGYGTYWVLAIVAFLFGQSRRRVTYFLLAPAVFFVGLSLFVNYMAARGDIRQLVWYEQASFGDRLQRIEDVFQNFEWLDLSNSRQLGIINSRLNQNWFVGLAVARLEAGEVEYLSGATFGKMIIALIPRVVWPNKPAVGGGGSVVSDLTGATFAEGTSVGAGQVLEFYGNFGRLGVIGGFLLYGWLLGRVDGRVVKALYRGDQRWFVTWYLIGLAMLQPGGNLLEVTVSAASGAVTGYYILGFLVKRYTSGPSRQRVMTGPTMR